MSKATQGVPVSTSELPDAERRRRLASVYRLLIELGQRGGSVAEERDVGQDTMGDQSEENRETSDSA